MMNQLYSIIFFLVPFLVAAQSDVFIMSGSIKEGDLYYKDGATFNIKEANTAIINFPKHEIDVGIFIYDGLLGIVNYTHTKTDKYQLSATAGINGGRTEGSYFFKSKTKIFDYSVGISSKLLGVTRDYDLNTRTQHKKRYNVILPTEKQKSYGLTGGVEYFTGSGYLGSAVSEGYNQASIVGGLSLLTTKQVSFLFNDKKVRRKSVMSRVFIGAVLVQSNLTNGTSVEPIKTTKVVPRVTYEISTSFIRSGGLKFLVGYQTPSESFDGSVGLNFGIGYRKEFGYSKM